MEEKTCTNCKHHKKCIAYHGILNAYSEIVIAEISNGKKTDNWLKTVLKHTAEICEAYSPE